MARAAKPVPADKPGRSIWLQGLLCGALASALPATALLTAILLAPTVLIAVMVDRTPARTTARTMLMMGLMVAAHGINQLWHGPNTIVAGLDIAANLRLTGSAWGLQGFGWLLTEVAPLLVELVLDAKARTRLAILQRRRAALDHEWTLPGGGDDQTLAG